MMFKYLYFYICCIILIIIQKKVESLPEPSVPGEIWAFLAAGSNGYYNYRHQADICHAYQILKKNGVPENNIIVMMADDVAYDKRNPTPGILINKPNGTDVYKGVRKDYTGSVEITGANFIHVLTGNKTAMNGIGTGRVIESNANDFVFVYFADHGTTGSLCFLDSLLAAADIHDALKTMVNKKKFNKMALYIEACESGSVFDNILEDDNNIFVMTAADPNESSYACYYDSYRDAYLGDLFSTNWMEEVERESLDKSLHHLFEIVRTKTKKSHVEEYGDLDIGNTKLSTFLKTNVYKRNDIESDLAVEMDAVKSEDVPIEILKKKITKANVKNDIGLVKKYVNELREIYHQRELIDKTLNKILNRITNGNTEKLSNMKQTRISVNKNNMVCCKEVTNAFSNKCFSIPRNPYAGKVMYPLLNVCNSNKISVAEVVDIIETVCSA